MTEENALKGHSVKSEVVFPPERTAEVPCERCNGMGALSAVAGHCFDIDGGLWHLPGECKAPECRGRRCCCPPCTSCNRTGRVARKHYAYCKRAECVGCLPTIAELDRNPNILDVFGEMLARCIEQSPEIKDWSALPWVGEHMLRGHEEWAGL